jgi:hypothetical protein
LTNEIQKNLKMKKTLSVLVVAALLGISAQAQVTQPVIPPGKIAVFKAGTSDGVWPMVTARVAPVFVQAFDPVTNNQSSPLLSVAMSTNSSVPGSVWINHHAGSEGGGISRTIDRSELVLEGYTGNILTPTSAKPSTDGTVTRGIVTLDAFTNATSVYSDLANWFGIPAGSASGTQDNPTGIASTDGQNFWGTGNFAGTSGELSGTLFYNASVGSTPFEVQNYIQAAAEARIIGGTLYIAVIGGGIYNFLDANSGEVVPLPFDPNVANPYQTVALTNQFINWGGQFKTVANFDMNPSATLAYGADETFGIVKFTNNGSAWVQAPYFFNSTNLGTLKQTSANQGCFGICVDFSGTNPVIYATTMENGYPVVNSKAGHQNQNRLIKIVDTGTAPGTNLVAQTLAVATTTNEFFGGVDFTPDLTPLITSQPANYATTDGGSAPFSVSAQSISAVGFQWLQNGTNLDGATGPSLNESGLDTTFNNFTYQCVVTNAYGAVTSTPAILTVTAAAVQPVITSGISAVTAFVNGKTTFAAVSAVGTQPFSYQWYFGTTALTDDGIKYSGSATASLSISNLVTGDDGNYYVVVSNSAGYGSNLVDVLTVKYQPATISAGQPQSVTTFTNQSASLTATTAGGTPTVTFQWYRGSTALSDTGEFSGSATTTLTINPASLSDNGNNYYMVASNLGGSVTSSVATVTILVPPTLSSVSYSNQVYLQNFNSLPDPGASSVNSINNPQDAGSINGNFYSLANPFDFNYPIINNSNVGGLGLSALKGWYGAADTMADVTIPDGITRFGAQEGDESTGGVIDFGTNDVNIVGTATNRALGLLTTSTTGSTAFALKLVNTSSNTLNYINLGFIGELWRQNSGSRDMLFGYTLDNTANSFVLTAQSYSNSTPVPGLAFNFPTNLTLTVVDGTQPSNQVSVATSNLALSSPWSPGAALWLIWSMNYYGNGAGNGYAIDNLNFSATEQPVTTPTLIGAVAGIGTGSGSGVGLTFDFTNTPGAGAQFSIWGTTNLASVFPVGWQNLGHPSENPPGTYNFTDTQATNKPARFYQVTSP